MFTALKQSIMYNIIKTDSRSVDYIISLNDVNVFSDDPDTEDVKVNQLRDVRNIIEGRIKRAVLSNNLTSSRAIKVLMFVDKGIVDTYAEFLLFIDIVLCYISCFDTWSS